MNLSILQQSSEVNAKQQSSKHNKMFGNNHGGTASFPEGLVSAYTNRGPESANSM